MDVQMAAAARALAAGDPLGALNRIALRDEAPALALRGIAMAQLGDLARAKSLLRQAGRAFGPQAPLARARCTVAEAEVALAARELTWPEATLAAAQAVLQAHGDHANAAHACCLSLRHLLLVGRLDEAERAAASLDPAALLPASRAAFELVAAGIAVRRLRSRAARAALNRAAAAAREAGIPALRAEVEQARLALDTPAARLIAAGAHRLLVLSEVEALLASPALIVDACRHAVHAGSHFVPLARRPVLFSLARALAEAWPADVSRAALIAHAFRIRQADDSHRARLRVEIGRLRALLRPLAEVRATSQGYALQTRGRDVAVLAEPVEGRHAAVLALLADGEPWSSASLALALGISQRTAQRALETLAAAGRAQSLGRGRARRWTGPPVPGFTTTLLLPAALAQG